MWILLSGVVGIWAIIQFNRLIQLKNQVKNAFAQIDVQMQRRFDLIPNLVESCQGYMDHERETLLAVTRAREVQRTASQSLRQELNNPQALDAWKNSAQELNQNLGRLLATVESYPDLKASKNVAALTEELTTTENRIGFSRQAYNDCVTQFNICLESFPGNLLAKLLGLRPVSVLELAHELIVQPPKVHFHTGPQP